MDVFRGQKTEYVLTVLKDNNILLVRVPANMTHIFQLLDLTVNGTFKLFTRKKFSKWCNRQILHALENGCEIMDAKTDAKLKLVSAIFNQTFIFHQIIALQKL